MKIQNTHHDTGCPSHLGLLPLFHFKGDCCEVGQTQLGVPRSPVPEATGTAKVVLHRFQGASLDVETSQLEEGRKRAAPSLHRCLQRCKNFLSKVQFQPTLLCPRLRNNIGLPGPDTTTHLLQTQGSSKNTFLSFFPSPACIHQPFTEAGKKH